MDRGSITKNFNPLGSTARANESHTQRWLRSEYERFGNDYVVYRGVHLFPNGAIIDGLASLEPPANKYECQKLIVIYWDLKVDIVETRFKELHQLCTENAVNGFSPADEAKLLAIKEEAAPLKAKRDEAKAELKKVMPYHLTEEAAAANARQAQLNEQIKREALEKINKITF